MRHLLALLLAAGSVAGVLTISAHASTPPRATTAQRATLTDSQIDAAIRVKLAKSKIGKDGFRFHVLHGVVTWEGTTSVMQHKGSATRMARTAGAIQVVNKIQISADGKTKGMAGLKRASVVE
ncbi:MAG: hypothetical protein WB992_17355 [Bryobacteraceae bacterium]